MYPSAHVQSDVMWSDYSLAFDTVGYRTATNGSQLSILHPTEGVLELIRVDLLYLDLKF